MAIVTGDRYLAHLVRFIHTNTISLLDGTLTLKLNPVGLHYVQSRLDALKELESLIAIAPVDYLRSYVTDLRDHRALEQLRRILRLLTLLKVFSVLPAPDRDPTPLSLLPFGRLRVLELRGCDISTSAARGLLELRHTLQKLICHNSTDALRHVFASRIADIKESADWTRLSFVSCACNGLEFMDESLQLLPVVETLDLSRNRFAKVDNLRKCTKLKYLDLEFNQLRTIACLSEVSCPLVKLVLRHNALIKLRGLENLKSVEGLDLSCNIISSFSELEVLANLPALQSLWLEGNPICFARWYRAHVFSFFSDPEKLKLDEKEICTREHWERFIILAKRQERRAGYGFYFPAKDDVKDKGNTDTKKMKHSRVASIEDDEQKRYFCSSVVDQESASYYRESWRGDDNTISNDSEVVSLMNKVEYMKKEFSVHWLREFKEWLEQSSEVIMDGSQCEHLNIRPVKGKYVSQSNGLKHLKEMPTDAPNMSQDPESRSHSNSLKSEMSFSNSYNGDHVNEYTNDKGISELPVLNGGDTRVANFKQGQLKVHSRRLHNLSPLAVNSLSNDSSTCEGSGQVEFKMSPAPLTAIDDIIRSHTSSIYPGSPPHYQQDLLHRRHYLEEELLQLLASSLSVASSDGDTSSSDDDSCRSIASSPEADFALPQDSTKLGTNRFSDTSPNKDNHHEGHGETRSNEKNRYLPHYGRSEYLPHYGRSEYPSPDQNKLSKHNNLNDHSSYENDQAVSITKNLKGKNKPSRRIGSLIVICNKEAENGNSNGMLHIAKPIMDEITNPGCSQNYACYSRENNWKMQSSSTIYGHDYLVKAKCGSQNTKQDNITRDFFNAEVADSRASETCEVLVKCGCIFQLGSDYQESEVALLRSSRNNLCILVYEVKSDGQGVIFKVLGCHSPEDVKEVVVGLGSQALRLYLNDDATTYLFLPRAVQKFNDLLCLLQVSDSTALGSGCILRSWEKVQVELLEKCLRRSLKMGIFLYSTLLFCPDRGEGELWLRRSLFVIEGYLLVCCENLVEFGSFADDFESSPSYYSLDSCCAIQNVSEMVIELHDNRCLTLIMNHVIYGDKSSKNIIKNRRQTDDQKKQVFIWKLKWYSEEAMAKFVSLLKAIYLGLTSSPLAVRCISCCMV